MVHRTVLVSGAGIAGPALALWLRRHGFRVTVVEQAPALRPGGQTVDIRGAARQVVERMGLMPQIRAARADERGVAFVDDHGRHLAEMPADMFGGEGIVAEIEIMRGDLSRILHDATRDDVEYRFGDRITALDQQPDGVEVTFASGTRGRFDVVVGADGAHSGVRRLAFGPESRFVTHLGAYTGHFTLPDPGGLDHWALMYNAPGGLVALLRPAPGGTAKAALSFTSPELDGLRGDPAAQRRILADRMSGAGWLVPQVLTALDDAPDFFLDAICRVQVDRWGQGRVALVGDAGYCGSPLTGLGTSMALVGSYVLAGELAASPDDPQAAFTRYQDKLRDYVAANLELPPGGIGGFAPQTRAMIRLRAMSMRMMGRWPMRGLLAKQFAKSDGVVLADYPQVRAPGRPASPLSS